jgi:nucleolar protein 9
MPKEFRKRGKKNKKSVDQDEWKTSKDDGTHQKPVDSESIGFPDNNYEAAHAGPSWIIPAQKASEEINLEAPFGYLDADVKAYFRTVDLQIRDWQENGADERNEDRDPNEGA